MGEVFKPTVLPTSCTLFFWQAHFGPVHTKGFKFYVKHFREPLLLCVGNRPGMISFHYMHSSWHNISRGGDWGSADEIQRREE
jgi:hypothetical protein